MADARERPIIFSAPMVRAILDGRKTQTRRIAKITAIMGNRVPVGPHEELIELDDGEFSRGVMHYRSTDALSGPHPIGYAVGDRAWVRETWRVASWDEDCLLGVEYAASPGSWTEDRQPTDPDDAERMVERMCDDFEARGVPIVGGRYDLSEHPIPWRSPIHMPRWASRITLEITGVRVQRLQDISGDDAFAEGVGETDFYDNAERKVSAGAPWAPERLAFADLWNHLHGPDAWDRNPWVAALSFRRIEGDHHG